MCTALLFLICCLDEFGIWADSSKSPVSHVVKPLNSSKPIFITPIKHPTVHNVRINSPAKGEKVPAGKNLEVSGISAGNHNATFINCHVSVIVNGIRSAWF